jgi:alpha-beta hydrolase superfamily lysophospholipase
MVVIREAMHEILLERDDVRVQFFAAFDAFVGEAQ